MRSMNDIFKVKIEYEGRTLTKTKAKGIKGLKELFDELEWKLE